MLLSRISRVTRAAGDRVPNNVITYRLWALRKFGDMFTVCKIRLTGQLIALCLAEGSWRAVEWLLHDASSGGSTEMARMYLALSNYVGLLIFWMAYYLY